MGAPEVDPAAGHDRPDAAPRQERRGALDLGRRRRRALDRRRIEERDLALVLERLGRDVHDDRPRPPGPELAHRLADRGGDVGHLEYPLPPLRDGRDRVQLVVHLVEEADVQADLRLGDLPRDHQDRRRRRVGGGEPRGGVEEARPRDDQRDADAAAGASIAVGHVRRGLLVARGDEADAGLVAERGHGAIELDAGEPEDDAHALAMERGHQRLPTGHPLHQTISSRQSARAHAVAVSRPSASACADPLPVALEGLPHLVGRLGLEDRRPALARVAEPLGVPGQVLLELDQREPLGEVLLDEGDVAGDHARPVRPLGDRRHGLPGLVEHPGAPEGAPRPTMTDWHPVSAIMRRASDIEWTSPLPVTGMRTASTTSAMIVHGALPVNSATACAGGP